MPSSLQNATIQAAILNITGSILAQLLKSYRHSTPASASSTFNPLGLEFIPILQFLIFALVSTPPNYMYQEFLERRFPGYPGKQKLKVDENGKVRLAAYHF